jgi:hypothetical protein
MPVGASSAGLGRTIYTNSGAVTTSSATPDMSLPANATLYQLVPACEAVDIILSVTANTGTNQSIIGAFVELQTSPDGGTTWVPFWRSTQITSSTAVTRTSMRTNGIGANESATGQNAIQTASASLIQNCVITANQRVVWTLSTASSNSPSLTFGLFAIAQTAGSRASY